MRGHFVEGLGNRLMSGEVKGRAFTLRRGRGLWRGTAHNGPPELDIKPYPDWEWGRLLIVTDFRLPEWLQSILEESA
jgi:hypothetical protein